MHEWHEIEKELRPKAKEISRQYNDAPVLIIVAGTDDVPRVMTASSFENGRLRDLLGILQTAIQWETHKHFSRQAVRQEGRE
jgi:hypothetical protein